MVKSQIEVITLNQSENNGLTMKNAVEVITPIQGNLFEIETTRTIEGIEMGVFSDGTPFLSQRGLQALCGLTANGISKKFLMRLIIIRLRYILKRDLMIMMYMLILIQCVWQFLNITLLNAKIL